MGLLLFCQVESDAVGLGLIPPENFTAFVEIAVLAASSSAVRKATIWFSDSSAFPAAFEFFVAGLKLGLALSR